MWKKGLWKNRQAQKKRKSWRSSASETHVLHGSQIKVSTTNLFSKWRILWQFRASRFCIPAVEHIQVYKTSNLVYTVTVRGNTVASFTYAHIYAWNLKIRCTAIVERCNPFTVNKVLSNDLFVFTYPEWCLCAAVWTCLCLCTGCLCNSPDHWCCPASL